MLLKAFLIAIFTIMCFIEDVTTNCYKGKLYCFDGANKVLGNIEVDRCWRWHLFKCSPCSADEPTSLPITLDRQTIYKAFEKYLQHCRYYYANTQLVYNDSFFYKRVFYG